MQAISNTPLAQQNLTFTTPKQSNMLKFAAFCEVFQQKSLPERPEEPTTSAYFTGFFVADSPILPDNFDELYNLQISKKETVQLLFRVIRQQYV